MRVLKERGLIKAKNFKINSNKKDYLYALTPEGLEGKVTVRSLNHKVNEFNELKLEVEKIRLDLK